MQQHEIHHFLLRYFHANHCEILENKPGYLVIQLTVELDKELMNRPFYWHYLEKTGGVANPMELTLITNPSLAPDDIKGEIIHFDHLACIKFSIDEKLGWLYPSV